MSLNTSTGTWSVAGSAVTSAGKDTSFTASLTYNSSGLTGGTLTVGAISIAGILDVSDLKFTYKNQAWSASATLAQGGQSAKIALAFTSAGQLSTGSITTGKITLFGALPLDSLALTYDNGAWGLATSATISGGGTLFASLGVNANGEITGGSISLVNGNISLFNELTLNTLTLGYELKGSKQIYTGAIGVQLPAPAAVSRIRAALTITNGAFTKGSITFPGNVPLADGIFLHQLSAWIAAPADSSGTEICGGAGLTAGPTVDGSTLLGLNAALDYTFARTPTTRVAPLSFSRGRSPCRSSSSMAGSSERCT